MGNWRQSFQVNTVFHNMQTNVTTNHIKSWHHSFSRQNLPNIVYWRIRHVVFESSTNFFCFLTSFALKTTNYRCSSPNKYPYRTSKVQLSLWDLHSSNVISGCMKNENWTDYTPYSKMAANKLFFCLHVY